MRQRRNFTLTVDGKKNSGHLRRQVWAKSGRDLLNVLDLLWGTGEGCRGLSLWAPPMCAYACSRVFTRMRTRASSCTRVLAHAYASRIRIRVCLNTYSHVYTYTSAPPNTPPRSLFPRPAPRPHPLTLTTHPHPVNCRRPPPSCACAAPSAPTLSGSLCRGQGSAEQYLYTFSDSVT